MLDKLHKIIQYLPENSIITGGLGLALHGIDLKRRTGDLDIIIPYFTPINIKHLAPVEHSSGNDFDYQYEVNIPDVGTFVIDIKIDPKAKWEIVTYNNVMYRVAPVHEILYYKAKYAKKGNIKHINDIKNILKYGV